METQKCDCCGKELPLSSFPRWVNKDGTIRAFHNCHTCVNAQQRAKRAHLKKEKILKSFTDEEIINEAIKRNITINK